MGNENREPNGPLDDPEVGKELKADELVEGEVIAVLPPEYPFPLTLWVTHVDLKHGIAIFHSGGMQMTFMNWIKDGVLVDDKKRQVRVFEFKGYVNPMEKLMVQICVKEISRRVSNIRKAQMN